MYIMQKKPAVILKMKYIFQGVFKNLLFFLFGISLTTFVNEALGNTAPSSIKIAGNKRVENETIYSYMVRVSEEKNAPYDYDQSLKKLYSTGLFSDISLSEQPGVLTITVVENPIINRIAFEGNSKVSDEILKAETTIRPRDIFSRPKIQNSTKKILDIYRLKGRFSAKVEPKIIRLPENRVDLVFEIVEGPVTTISTINFLGNTNYSANKLKNILLTKESRWYRFFTNNDTYDPDRLAADKDQLYRFYLNQGYADFRVISAVAELSPNAEEFFITFTLEEGERYQLGAVTLKNRIADIDIKKFQEYITLREGDWFNESEVEKTIRLLTDQFGNKGYAFVEIKQYLKKDSIKKIVDIILEVVESPKVFIERIDIEGNVHTRDSVIRREIKLAEGDGYNTSKEKESRQRLKELDFFKTVDISHERSDDPNKTIMKVNVTEKATGNLSFGGGYSMMEGPFANIKYNQGNLMGRGQDLRSEFWLARYNKAFDISFTEPYFLDKNLSATIGAFHNHQSRGYAHLSLFDQTSHGGMVGVGYNLSDFLSQSVRYTIHQDKIGDMNPAASYFIRQQTGMRLTSSIGQTLMYDKRDSRIETTSGYYVSLSNDFAGVGGNTHYLRNRLETGAYYPLKEQWILSMKARGGILFSFGHPTRIIDRFSLGGSTLRGFDYSGIGPHDRSTGDPLNGMKFYSGSIQLTFPLGLPEEFGVKGYVFSDGGSLWKTNTPGNQALLIDKKSPRLSAGGGVAWNSPLGGTITIDVGQPIRKAPFDRTRVLLINMGTAF